MGRNMCSFIGCERSKTGHPNLHFYSFPVNRPICDAWVRNCANEYLNSLTKKALRNRLVCEKHFEEDCFSNESKHRLIRNAIPTIFSMPEKNTSIANKVSTPTRTPSKDVEETTTNAIEHIQTTTKSNVLSQPSGPVDEMIPVMDNLIAAGSFEHHCRICSCKNEKEKLVYIFENDDLLEKITSCLPINIHQGDQLPHHVCEKCLSAIESTSSLINRAQSSEKYFFNCLNSFGTVKIKEEEVTDDRFDQDTEDQKEPRTLELDGTFSCDLCDARLPDAEDLNTHIQENHVNPKAPPNTEFIIHKICSLCGQLFDCDEMYVLHKCESHPDCPHCHKTMPTKCLLNRHIMHSCKQLFFCPHCHQAMSGKIPFMKHVQGHTGVRSSNECLACDRKSHGNGEVTEHTCERGNRNNSSPGKKYKCYICGHAYKRQMNLAKHCLQHQPKTKWDFKCTKCNDVFEKERSLHAHYEKVHKMPKTWVCRYCGKTMSTKLSVQIHERIHTNVKPYVCEWCGNAFRCKPNLIQHQAMHTGIRKHKCHVCGKMFSRPFFLKTHLRVHTGERPYQCDICEKRFTQLTDMRRHRKRHDKPSQVSRMERRRKDYKEEVHEEIIYVAVDDEELVGQTFVVETEEEIPLIMQAQGVSYETVELKYETVETS